MSDRAGRWDELRKTDTTVSWPGPRGRRETASCTVWSASFAAGPLDFQAVHQAIGRAMAVLATLPTSQGPALQLPAGLREVAEGGRPAPRSPATAEQLAELDMVATWLMLLPDQRTVAIVAARAIGLSVKLTARLVGMGYDDCRKAHNDALALIVSRIRPAGV